MDDPRVSIRARKCEQIRAITNNCELFVLGCCKRGEQRTMFALKKGKSANKMYSRDGLNSLPHRPGAVACPTAVLSHRPMPSLLRPVCPSRPSITSFRHVHPSHSSVMSVRHVCCQVCPSHLSIMSVCHICSSRLSVTSVTSVRHVCQSRQSIMSVRHFRPSRQIELKHKISKS